MKDLNKNKIPDLHLNIPTFNEDNFYQLCDELAYRDAHLKMAISTYGYPPIFSRTPSFATLIHIILEQQVSLASAKAAFLKLQEKIGHILPAKLLLLSDEEMKACYFSRQKMKYARALAKAVYDNTLQIERLILYDDEEVRIKLKQIKGIGDWTANIFLMMALHRCDCFPAGDIALLKSLKEVKMLSESFSKEEMLAVTEDWKPYRTIAAFILWHVYIKKRNIIYNYRSRMTLFVIENFIGKCF